MIERLKALWNLSGLLVKDKKSIENIIQKMIPSKQAKIIEMEDPIDKIINEKNEV